MWSLMITMIAMQEEQAVNLDDVVEEYLSLMGAK
jgi:replicative DNA helicase